MTIEELKERKKALGYSDIRLAELSGVPLGTVQKVFSGATSAPGRATLLALERVLCEVTYSNGDGSGDILNESPAVYDYDRQGSYTLDDYYALPEERRVELIDGVFYDMTAPSARHQLIGGEIYAVFRDYIRSHRGDCIPCIAPFDVQLDKDNKTMVEPDVFVVCNRDIIINRCVYGAPDLVVEVLSPSTKRKDTIIKLNKYLNAGVREYWMIDPLEETVTVYDFEHDSFSMHYTFDDLVPVMIWDGACTVDFREIRDYISFLQD